VSPWFSDLFLSSQSDERLVALARAGHERAFAAIVERYRRPLYQLARRLDSGGRAEDVVQQTFLNAFASLQSGAEVGHLSGWLHRVLRNTVVRLASADRVEPRIDPETPGREAVEDVVERSALVHDALTEVARLPGRQRDAFVATAIHGRSRADVAATMGVSEGSVRQLVHRARASVRTAVSGLVPFPLARWLSSAPPPAGGDRISEIALSAGAAGSGGAALKLGALLASGVVAAGVATSDLPGRSGRRTVPHADALAAAGHAGARGPLRAASAAEGTAISSGSSPVFAGREQSTGFVAGAAHGTPAMDGRRTSGRASSERSRRRGDGRGDGTSGVAGLDGRGDSGGDGRSTAGTPTSGGGSDGAGGRSGRDGGGSGSLSAASSDSASSDGATSDRTGSSDGGATSGSPDGSSGGGTSNGGTSRGFTDGGTSGGGTSGSGGELSSGGGTSDGGATTATGPSTTGSTSGTSGGSVGTSDGSAGTGGTGGPGGTGGSD
jgi:RNA polymerase sigma factor (sigma-70 family)